MAGRDLRGHRWLPPLGIAGLVLLTILDVVLVALAFRHVETTPASPGAASSPASSTRGSSTPSPSPPEPSESAPVTPARGDGPGLPAGPLLLALAPDGTVLAATSASCTADGPLQVAVAGPGVGSFRPVPVTADITAVLALSAEARDDLVVVGAGPDCEATAYRGRVRARTWTAGPAGDRWYLDPDGGTVHAPGGPVEPPCSPVALSTQGAVRVLCDDGALLGTSDAGRSWATLGRVDRAEAIAFDGPGRGIALATRRNCAVTVLLTDDGGAGWRTAACLEGEAGRAVALRGGSAVAYVDGAVVHSADGGETWEPAG